MTMSYGAEGCEAAGNPGATAQEGSCCLSEALGGMHVNDSWLADLGWRWWSSRSNATATWRLLGPVKLTAERSPFLLLDLDQRHWYVKEPRISLLMPRWDRFASQPLPVVLSMGEPREVASSLFLHNGIPPWRALAVWFAYVREARAAAHDRPLLVLDYDALVSDPEPVLAGLGQFGIKHAGAQVSWLTMDALVRLAEPALRRNLAVGTLGVAHSEVEEALVAYLHICTPYAASSATPETPELRGRALDLLDDVRDEDVADEFAREATALIARLEEELRRAADPPARVLARGEELRLAREEQEYLVFGLTEAEGALHAEREASGASRRESDDAERALHEVSERGRAKEQVRALLEQDRQRLRTPVADSEARMAESSAQAGSLARAADERLAEAMNVVHAACAEVRLATDQVAVMRDALAAKESELVLSHARLAETRDEAQRMLALSEEAREALSREVTDAWQAYALLESELARVRREFAEASGCITGLESDVAAARQDAQDRVAETDARMREVQGLLDERDRRAAEPWDRPANAGMQAATLTAQVTHLREALWSGLSAVSRVEARARAREASHMEATTNLTERLAVAPAGRNQLVDALNVKQRRLAYNDDVLQQMAVEREKLRDQLVEISQRVDEAAIANVELTVMGAGLSQWRARPEGRSAAQAEITDALTAALVEERSRAVRAEQSLTEVHAESERLRALLGQEHAKVARLTVALTEAFGTGQDLSEELDGVKASRTYRVRRRLSRDASGSTRLPYFVLGVEPLLLAEAIAVGLIDPQWYASQNPDIEGSGVDLPYQYFVQCWKEAREPSADAGPVLGRGHDAAPDVNPVLALLMERRGRNQATEGSTRE